MIIVYFFIIMLYLIHDEYVNQDLLEKSEVCSIDSDIKKKKQAYSVSNNKVGYRYGCFF